MNSKDVIAAVSLANLVYLRLWAELFASGPTTTYWLKNPPRASHFIALLINITMLSLVFLGGIIGLRQGKSWARRLIPFASLAILGSLANSFRTLIGNRGNSLFLKFVEQRAPAIGVALAILITVALTFGGLRALKPAYLLLVILSPFALISIAQAAYHLAHVDADSMADGPFAARLPAKPASAPRLLWFIFDEWDQDLTFPDRPPRISLPEIDRLRAGALYAANAQPAGPMTDVSMPALTIGRRLTDILPASPGELMITPEGGGGKRPWSAQDNVFREARALGFNTAVVGWAIPYCRVLKSDLTECWWQSGSNQYNSAGSTIPELLFGQPRSLWENIYRSPFGQSLSTVRHAVTYHEVLAKAKAAVTDTANGLTLLHMPVPHPPYFYSAATGRDDLRSTPFTAILDQGQQGYIDALALTSRTIGELRTAMEQAGLWNSTTHIFSADHPFRHRVALDGKPVSRHVPYLVKLAGQTGPVDYQAPFSTLLTRKLILAVLSGEVAQPGQLSGWLDAHRGEFPLQQP
jgi:hypothetical protein